MIKQEFEVSKSCQIIALLEVMKSQNEYMKPSHWPKFERNIREISALEDYVD
jgi:hypothetical protein